MHGRLEELEEEYGIPSPLKAKVREEAEIAQAIDILVGRLERGPISLENAAEILQEDDHVFVKKVIKEMELFKIIGKSESLFFLLKK